uniref:Reverse transcriptase domain-containing protein n=1 Tax=Panagrolaimus sp. JU765 TaxID=591449 RepID=A0AC34Q582_9BILA
MAPRRHRKQSKDRNYWTKGELKHLEGFAKQAQDNGEAVDLQLLLESREEYALLNNEIFPPRTPKALELKVYACFRSRRGGTTVVRNRAPDVFNPQSSQEENMETEVESASSSDDHEPSVAREASQMECDKNLKPDEVLVKSITSKYNEIKRNHLWRTPLRKTRIPAKDLKVINDSIEQCLNTLNIDDITKLDHLVYATGAILMDKYKKSVDMGQIEWAENHKEALKVLKKYLSWAILLKDIKREKLNFNNLSRKQWNAWCALSHKYQVTHPSECLEIVKQDLKAVRKMGIVRKTKDKLKKIHALTGKRIVKTVRNPIEINPDRLRTFWYEIVGKEKQFTVSERYQEWFDAMETVTRQPDNSPIAAEFMIALKKVKPWKAAGPDGIQAYWFKRIKAFSNRLKSLVVLMIENEIDPPRWLCAGRVVSIPKGGDKDDCNNYRPISCLNTAYKLLTGTIHGLVRNYCDTNKVLPIEQRACRRGDWATTRRIVQDSAFRTNVQHNKMQATMAWIDYSKAYDSVSHDFLFQVLIALKVPSNLLRIIRRIMNKWHVRYIGANEQSSRELQIKRGVLQGDTLSPLLFCLALTPISFVINEYVTPVSVNGMMFNHQYYMDDLILYAKLREIVYAVKLVKTISAEVGLDMNLKKCAINFDKDGNDINGIPCLSEIQVYKYLGIHCNEQTQQSVTRELAMKVLQGKKHDILNNEASYKQKRLLYNSQLIPKLSYISTNVITGSGTLMSDLAQMDEFDKGLPLWLREKDRKLMQLSANSNRLFLPIKRGGLGFKSAREDMCKQIARCYTYIKFHRDLREIDELLESLAKRQKRNTISDFRQMLNICQGLNLNIECSRGNYIKVNGTCFLVLKKAVQEVSKIMDMYFAEMRLEQWQSKPCAGDVLREEDINIPESFRYLKLDFGIGPILNAMAIQEKAIMCYAHPANAALTDRKCRRCRQHRVLKPQLETIQHIMTGCPIGQVTTMVTRHDDVVRHLVQELRKAFNFKKLHYTEHIPKSDASECKKYRMFVDCPQPVTSEIICNKPDIVLETDEMVYIIEIGISWFTILDKQSRWKYCKYAQNSTIRYEDFDNNQGEAFVSAESLKNRLKDLFRKEVKVIPLVLGVCGEITDRTLGFYKQLPLPANRIDKVQLLMQRSVMLGSHYVLKSHMGTVSCASKP